jgi:hypothetical protein
MIPGDLAARLRMLTEASFFSGEQNVAPLARARAIPPICRFHGGRTHHRHPAEHQQGPDLPGQGQWPRRGAVTAPVRQGRRHPRTDRQRGHAEGRFCQPGQSCPAPSDKPALSQTGKLISFLLTGQPSPGKPASTAVKRWYRLPPRSPPPRLTLAARLGGAVSESGLFYESHQTRWLSGQMSTAALQREPQGQRRPPGGQWPPSPKQRPTLRPGRHHEHHDGTTPSPSQADEAAPVAERLLPLVHQQLDAIATHQVVWQGQSLARATDGVGDRGPERSRPATNDGEPEPYWNTTLRLTLPGLGGIEARLHLTPAGVAVRLIAGDARSRDALMPASPAWPRHWMRPMSRSPGWSPNWPVPDEQP